MTLPAGLGLIDLHAHVLPGIDDGAADLDDSLAMADQALEDGITVVCATPHIHDDHDVEIDALAGQVDALNRVLRDAGRPLSIARGGELSAPLAARLDDGTLRAVTLGGSGRWVLVEPGPGPMDGALDECVDALHERGVRCIVAHPERHAGADAAQRLTALVERGALVQVTAAFLTGGHGAAPVMLDWAAQGLVHLVASDAHSSRAGRPLAIRAGLDALLSVPRLAAHGTWIAREAPAAILAGDDVTVPF
ncbi:MAG: hypothetical protein J7513_17760 [Solirubrobacteraceae bacterium]|nr:hypothetical protein [Solirubrobacteraceae bacterium]